MKTPAFLSDYMEGAHPSVLDRLVRTNQEKTPGYGADDYTNRAAELIRAACGCPEAEVFFLVGGTQTNATVIDALLRPSEGVLCAQTGHIAVHEAGAIEACGHKTVELPAAGGKLSAETVRDRCAAFYEDGSRSHMVRPGMVYISQPTELGTLYSLEELEALRRVCDALDLPLYADGARLAYALACPENDVTLPDLARLCDVFYIGGTKCGALFGEAVVFPRKLRAPYFFTDMKRHGAVLAKGRLLGLQFEALFADGLYGRIGQPAQQAADLLRGELTRRGYEVLPDSPTNQVFVRMKNEDLALLRETFDVGLWEKTDDSHTVVRFCTSWATKLQDVEELLDTLPGS
ncbi:MAG: low specificity L-threonine aldolase [Lachnospiraceae bacterium]|nr:low specificity L-threonine aldolase [Lachnospiraceae bacterium]